MERFSAPAAAVDELRDGFELAHSMLGARGTGERPCAVMSATLARQLTAVDSSSARRAATRMQTRLTPANTRGLDSRCKALLAVEVGGATGRRWLAESPPRPGFTAHAGVRACVRALAIERGAELRGSPTPDEDNTDGL